jgi:hypothetical protein
VDIKNGKVMIDGIFEYLKKSMNGLKKKLSING